MDLVIARSYLYVPGDQPGKLANALRRGADALIFDLEDGVAQDAKDAGRAGVAAFLDGVAGDAPDVELWLRINPGEAGLMDVAVAWRPVLTGVMPAKTESVADLERLDGALRTVEERAGVAPGSTAVVPLLESASAIVAASQIAAGPRVRRLQVGEADLSSGLGLDSTGGGTVVLHTVRSLVILASAAAGIEPPVAPVSTDFRDLQELRRSTQALAGMGYLGRACIHPDQVAVVNEVFTPGAEVVAAARALVERFDGELAAGRGVMLGQDGRMVDEATVRRARILLARADSSLFTPPPDSR